MTTQKTDSMRSRNFEKHLHIIEPQLRYYQALNHRMPGYVHQFKANTVEDNIKNILNHVEVKPAIKGMEMELCDFMIHYLKTNQP